MRPTDWSPLSLSADPTPGDPTVVRSGGQQYQKVAEAIARAASTLRRLDAGSSNAESVTALLETRDELVDKVGTAEGRYRTTGQALLTYATTLDRVQSETLTALTRARAAVADLAEANKLAQYYGDQADDASKPDQADDKRDYEQKQQRQQHAADAANAVIAAEQRNVQASVGDRDSAANSAIAAIHNIIENDDLNDSWWDNWGSKLTQWVAKIAEAIATIAGILALLVCWIPVIGQALAGILLIVAEVAGIVAALANILLAATGEKSWGEALLSVVFAALGCIGLGAAGRAGATMFKAMMMQAAGMAGRGSGSLLGRVGIRALLRPGAMGRMATGRTFTGIKGALGEEIVGVKAFVNKGSFPVVDLATGATRPGAQPDGVLKLLSKMWVGDAKNVLSLSNTRQIREYTWLANQGGTAPFVFVNAQTKLASTLAAAGVKVVTFEKVLAVKINAIINMPAAIGEGLSVFSD